MTCSPGKRVEGDRHGFPPAALPTPAALSVAPPIGRRLCSVWLLLAPVRLLRRPPSAPYAAFFFLAFLETLPMPCCHLISACLHRLRGWRVHGPS